MSLKTEDFGYSRRQPDAVRLSPENGAARAHLTSLFGEKQVKASLVPVPLSQAVLEALEPGRVTQLLRLPELRAT